MFYNFGYIYFITFYEPLSSQSYCNYLQDSINEKESLRGTST